MSNLPTDPQSASNSRVLLPNPRPFLIRAGIWGLLAVLVLAMVLSRKTQGAHAIAIFLALAAAFEWITLKSSSIRLDENGFDYRSFGKSKAAYQWTDIDSFSVVSQRVLGFIKVDRYLGWHFSKEYKHYKRLTIPRALVRAVGLSDAIVKTPGYNARELAGLMTEYLERSHAKSALRMRDTRIGSGAPA
jgi:hypothetical protein